MNILGIGLSHCCSVCLIIDGEIVFSQEEDRFSRNRRQKGRPSLSLDYMFDKFNLKESDIDLCVLSDIQTAKNLNISIDAKKTIVCHHHLAHIMSGWALSNNKNFDSVSLDGGGDYGSWMSFGIFRDRKLVKWVSNCGSKLTRNGHISAPSLFDFRPGVTFGQYWSVPSVVNFGMVDKSGIGGYEGKLMGLAGHGDARLFDPVKNKYDASFSLKKKDGFSFIKTAGSPKIGENKLCVLSNGDKISLKELRRLRKYEKVIVSEYNLKEEEDKIFAANFGAYLQEKTNIIIKDVFAKNFDVNMPVVVSGGTFANVCVNGELNKKYKLFVVPSMGDEGLALGSAAWGAYLCGEQYLKHNTSMYMGYDAGSNIGVDFVEVASALADNKIVGLIEGKMEFGPRALGARSIISDPQDNNVNWTINERLGRVEYMPFAPVILEEYADNVLMGWKKKHDSSKHMTLTYKVKPEWVEKIKGVVHVDGTVRPQIINKETNPVYYSILKEYCNKTGIPVLINTSFNAHGEPMLRTVEDGLKALEHDRIDLLVAGNEIHYK